MAQQPLMGQGPLIIEAFTIILRHMSRLGSSGRVISPTQNLYLITHNTHNRQMFMLRAGFKPTVSASDGRRRTP